MKIPILNSLLDLVFPKLCVCCGGVLMEGEENICLTCLYTLPRVVEKDYTDNKVMEIFLGRVRLEKAMSWCHFDKETKVQNILHHIKYKGKSKFANQIGEIMAREMLEFFADIDAIVPVPLHPKKERMRGYNQSEEIARGVQEVVGLPIFSQLIERTRFSETQTHKNKEERWKNAEGLFSLAPNDGFEGKHLLLVDDVLTTGSTDIACLKCLEQIPNVRLSFLSLAVGR
jgi:ComF family protein